MSHTILEEQGSKVAECIWHKAEGRQKYISMPHNPSSTNTFFLTSHFSTAESLISSQFTHTTHSKWTTVCLLWEFPKHSPVPTPLALLSSLASRWQCVNDSAQPEGLLKIEPKLDMEQKSANIFTLSRSISPHRSYGTPHPPSQLPLINPATRPVPDLLPIELWTIPQSAVVQAMHRCLS